MSKFFQVLVDIAHGKLLKQRYALAGPIYLVKFLVEFLDILLKLDKIIFFPELAFDEIEQLLSCWVHFCLSNS